MRSMGEGAALVILTLWRGDTLNAPLPSRRGGTSPRNWSERLHGVGVGFVGLVLRLTDKPHPSAAARLPPSPEGEG
jgi:hypothetical protein